MGRRPLRGHSSTAVTAAWSDGVRPSREERSMPAATTRRLREQAIQSMRSPPVLAATKPVNVPSGPAAARVVTTARSVSTSPAGGAVSAARLVSSAAKRVR